MIFLKIGTPFQSQLFSIPINQITIISLETGFTFFNKDDKISILWRVFTTLGQTLEIKKEDTFFLNDISLLVSEDTVLQLNSNLPDKNQL